MTMNELTITTTSGFNKHVQKSHKVYYECCCCLSAFIPLRGVSTACEYC